MEERKSSASELGFTANNWWQNVKTRGRMKLLIRRRSIKTFRLYYPPFSIPLFSRKIHQGLQEDVTFQALFGIYLVHNGI